MDPEYQLPVATAAIASAATYSYFIEKRATYANKITRDYPNVLFCVVAGILSMIAGQPSQIIPALFIANAGRLLILRETGSYGNDEGQRRQKWSKYDNFLWAMVPSWMFFYYVPTAKIAKVEENQTSVTFKIEGDQIEEQEGEQKEQEKPRERRRRHVRTESIPIEVKRE
jgi:hypothetical protein